MAAAAAEFRDYVRNRIAGLVVSDHWAAKTNERAGRHDSPDEYRKVQDRIDTLLARQIMARVSVANARILIAE